ncbi:hypothetical protein K488DRAFT_88410 [Vararia minispora EC-137]|uniref:Uncharacterized protein n=1 Tax=Vararia minispora EC-137 TaxID=1314806 RepID=A0ACB8QDD2_9AGAM|nr:hypothetical protein K488DRAFT_88410 [Vararia minispora EC-137]
MNHVPARYKHPVRYLVRRDLHEETRSLLARSNATRWVPFAQVLERLMPPEGSRSGVFERHVLVRGEAAGPARTSNMALDESILRDCLKHVLTLCYATDPLNWARRFCDEIDGWVHDYAYNAHAVLTHLATPDHRGQPPLTAEEREARFYACRRAMAGLTEECHLIVQQGADVYRAATREQRTVLDGQDVDEEAFRRTFGWWLLAERLRFCTTVEYEPFRRSERLRNAAPWPGFYDTFDDPAIVTV